MRLMTRYVLASVVVTASAAFANAQTGGGGGGGASGGSIGSSTPQGSSSTPNTGFQAAAPLNLTAANSGNSTGATVNSSNAFSSFYANPQFQGKAGVTGSENQGGFGTPLYNSTGGGNVSTGGNSRPAGTSTGTSGRSSTSSGMGGTSSTSRGGTGGMGSTSGFGSASGFGSGASNSGFTSGGRSGATTFGNSSRGNQSTGGEIIPLQRQIAYTASVRIPAPVITPVQMQTDLRSMLDRSSMLTRPGNIQLAVQGNVVLLRGAVASQDEAQAAEGMIRLTPGVREVKNELTYPPQ